MLGAFYLLDLDRKLKKINVKCYRYMNDILILAVSDETVKRFSKRIARLYEHGADSVRCEYEPIR